ncbi:MAG: flagellar hook-basal body complex protein [Solirubrobacteraceae bacterium]
MFAAISGLQANQTMLDVTANNLANLNTVGYKDQSVQFAAALSDTLQGAGGPTAQLGGINPIQIGVGVQVAGIETDEGTGTLQSTGNPLDVAIEGGGYLVVADGNGTTAPVAGSFEYTRAGDFAISADGHLLNQNGQYVMGYPLDNAGTGPNTTGTASYLKVPTNAENVDIGTDGSLYYTDATTGDVVIAGYLALAPFANPQGLQSIGNNNFISTANAGPGTITTPGNGGLGTTISGELEGSNVDLATEFTNMITAQRGYQANTQVITVANQMLQTLEQVTT